MHSNVIHTFLIKKIGINKVNLYLMNIC